MLQIKNLSVELGGKKILENVNIELHDGEFLSILGPSGCGKSTLLKTICGFVEHQSGEILLDNVNLNNIPTHKRNIVLLFQDLRLFPNMLVWENVAFPLKMEKMPKRERKEKAYALLKAVSLEGFENRKVTTLSGGQQQRVALARAIAKTPKVLLLDEAFSGLDELLREEMQNLLSSLHIKYKLSIIFVTHDKNEAEKLSDRILTFNEGEICV